MAILPSPGTLPVYLSHQQRFPFDGYTTVFLLDYEPHTSGIVLTRSDGKYLTYAIGIHGGGTVKVDAVITPSALTIEFTSPHWPGAYVEMHYVYDIAKAQAHKVANALLGNYSISITTPGYNTAPLEQEQPTGAIPVPDVLQGSDRQDYLDIATLMTHDGALDYSQCRWIVNLKENRAVFTEEEWQRWYEYALEHCERFAKDERARP